MATITTTTTGNPFRYPASSYMVRSLETGKLFTLIVSTAGNYQVWVSANNGTTWAQHGSDLVRANVQEYSSLFISVGDWINWAYRTNESSQDRIYFRRQSSTTGVWEAECLLGAPANGGVAGAIHTGLDVVTYYNGPGNQINYQCVAVATTSGAQTGVTLYGAQAFGASSVVNNDIFGPVRSWFATGSGRFTPSIEVEHVGDGISSAVPNLWVTWGNTTAFLVKLPWASVGWTGPGSVVNLGTFATSNGNSSRWDGQRLITAVVASSSLTSVSVIERNQANTSQVARSSPAHTTGNITNWTVSYNASTKDFRVYAVGTTNATLYYVDYSRSLDTWSGWTQVSATAITGTNGVNFGARRTTYGNAKYDLYYFQTPNAIHTQQSPTYAPLAPTWDDTGLLPRNGDAQDVAATLALQWTYRSVDPSDTQGFVAIRRQIGAGAFEYRRFSDNTWQVAEVQNAGAGGLHLMATGWAPSGATTATIQYWVKTWSAGGVAGPYSATPYVVVPSTPVSPTIVTPTAAQVLATSVVTMTWTVSEQQAYWVNLKTNPGGTLVYFSGWLTSITARSFTIPYDGFNDGTGWTIELFTKNNEGLTSGAAGAVTRNFTVEFVDPAAPIPVYTLQPADGEIRITVSNPTPSGTQPAVSYNEIYRRLTASDTASVNPNPDAEVNTTGWSATGSATLSRSTVQFKQGVASFRVVPNGVATTPGLVSTANLTGIVGGTQYLAEAWIRADTVNKLVGVQVDWYTGAPALISSSDLRRQPVAGTWIYLVLTATAPATAVQATMSVRAYNTPAAGDAFYTDEVRFRPYNGDDGIRITTLVPNNGAYDDWQVASGVAYTYRVRTVATNGTATFGPWTP